jgi:hypothetical protein
MFALSAAVVVSCGTGPEQPTPEINAATVALDGWQRDGEAETYVGDSLFELINGGAEVYHRYGFVQARAAQFTDAEGRSIALEIFEMDDLEGARGIFDDKTGGSGRPIDIGDEAAAEDYYLNFRSGPYLVTVTGFDSDEPTTDGILRLAREVDAALGEEK